MTHGVNIKAVFSDDDDEEQEDTTAVAGSAATVVPSLATMSHTATGFVDPMLTSRAYHIHQAESALASLKQIWREDAQDGWKKALKHKKSGVVVHIKNEKIPIFRGEAVIHGFSPQSIFYVIGMRRLWDEQYDDGNLVENLNDTTSLTYEVCKATSSLCTNSMNRPRDMALVEKIECTRDGAIFFACTSVESPCVPRVQGRVRAHIKLQGWILQPVHGSPSLPATRVMYVIQESVKGWVPGFAKKSFARRPLVIALVNEYLEKKADRMRAQKMRAAGAALQGHLHPSVSSSSAPSGGTAKRLQPFQRPSIIDSPASIGRKSTVFAEDEPNPLQTMTPESEIGVKRHAGVSQIDYPAPTLPVAEERLQHQQRNPSRKRHSLYPPHRHLGRKNEAMSLIKRLSASLDSWVLSAEGNGFKTYTLKPHEQCSESSLILSSLTRIDRTIQGDLTAEQICSVVQCFDARKMWDNRFLHGRILERFSQKDYLVEWKLANPSSLTRATTAITSIDTDPSTGIIIAMTSGIACETKDLDSWVFRPNLQNIKAVDLSWISSNNTTSPAADPSSLLRLNALEAYIAQYGCPPYIRRVAGKVTDEAFDNETGVYNVTFIAKHELHTSRSRSGGSDVHHRRGHWCTDIRVHPSRYPAGFSITLTPEAGTRVDMTPSSSIIRVYTTSAELEGKRISLQIVPKNSQAFSPECTLNGVALVPRCLATAPVFDPPSPAVATAADADPVPPPPPSPSPSPSLHPPQSVHVEPTAFARTTSVLQQHELALDITIPQPQQQRQQSAAPIPCHNKPPSSSSTSNNKKITRISPDRFYQQRPQQQVLFIPEGYKLIPQQHNSNIIIISDELTFNGQQLAVVFLAMVLSYYMGKLACASAYC